ncbi:MAG: FAD:protein FMN transferase [Verrucomicrobia bacterium]|nr:FAD:protein FMN transferase [Verrucomicrobiota bacterium]
MRFWCIRIFLALATSQSSLPDSHSEAVRRSQPLLGTFVTVSAYGPERENLNNAVSLAFKEIQRMDTLMSIHRPESEVSLLNSKAFQEPVSVSPELFSVISKAQEIAKTTDGAFDPTIRPLAELWGFIWKEYRLPTREELAEVLPRVNANLVKLDSKSRTVRFLKPNISVDLGGIAKGYCVDRAIETLRASGITNALVKAGGDVRVMGHPPGRSSWEIQIEDPNKQGNRVVLELTDAALSTSGNYENFFRIDGRTYSHILDPRSGYPVEGIAACSVIAKTCMESDAWATACFVLGPKTSLSKFGDQIPMRFTLASKTGESEWPTIQSAAVDSKGNRF